MGRPKVRRSSAGSGLTSFIAVLVILGLVSAVAYMGSSINHRRFRFAQSHGNVIVERGLFFPLGFAAFVPDAQALVPVYAPVKAPKGVTLPASEAFEDRAELDRALFLLLASWARRGLEADDDTLFEDARGYVERADALPGISEQQRSELKVLRGELAFQNGKRLMADTRVRLKQAREEFRLAAQLKSGRAAEASHWLDEVERHLAAYNDPTARPDPTPRHDGESL